MSPTAARGAPPAGQSTPVPPPAPHRSDAGRRHIARLVKPLVFVAAALPAAWLAWQLWLAWTGAPNTLGADPIEYVERETGQLALRFLAFTLAVTPLRQLTGWNALAKYRRMLGLFTFFYASLHLTAFAALDLELNLGEVGAEIVKRPYLTLGMLGWLLLLPLAVTSTKGWIRRLGGRRWNRLHRATYAVAVLGVVHFWWSVKKDVTEPVFYAIVFAALLGWRLLRRRRATAAARVSAPGGVGTMTAEGRGGANV